MGSRVLASIISPFILTFLRKDVLKPFAERQIEKRTKKSVIIFFKFFMIRFKVFRQSKIGGIIVSNY
jgi:hypothetical protein